MTDYRREETAEYREQIANELQRSPDYRVLRRFVPRVDYVDLDVIGQEPRATLKVGVFVDCETTGLDPETDEVIQVAIQPFLFDNEPEGAERIVALLPGYVGYEQPKNPIDKAIAARSHGITDAMVEGLRFDDDKVNHLLSERHAAIVIAHKADFDRRRFERRFPMSDAATLPWACSLNEVDWTFQYGAVANSLGAALAAVGEFSDDSHDALEDCRIGVHVLASATREVECPEVGREDNEEGVAVACSKCGGSGSILKTAFNDLLQSARVPTFRLWAIFPFDESAAARMKVRKYRWNDGKDGRLKAWYRDVKPDHVEVERAWILSVVPHADIRFTKFNARDRWSSRV